MTDQYIPLGTRVLISNESEYYPGEIVWIVDFEPDHEYAYCVSPQRSFISTINCEWVLGSHVSIPDGKRADSRPLELGDRVVARDDNDFTIRPEMGYVSEMDESMVGIAYTKGGETEILVRRRFVKHI